MLTLLLTRHGHTDRSEPEQYLGQRVAATLTARGRRDARRLAQRLAEVDIDRAISSPLARAVETAELLFAGRPVERDARLAELDYGAWEGLTVGEIDRLFPGEREQYDADPATHRVGGAESGRHVAQRLAPLIDELLEWAEGGPSGGRTCLLVGHSSVNRILLAMCLGVPLADYRRRFRQDWLNLTVLDWPDRAAGPMLLLANDMGHVRGLGGSTWEP